MSATAKDVMVEFTPEQLAAARRQIASQGGIAAAKAKSPRERVRRARAAGKIASKKCADCKHRGTERFYFVYDPGEGFPSSSRRRSVLITEAAPAPEGVPIYCRYCKRKVS